MSSLEIVRIEEEPSLKRLAKPNRVRQSEMRQKMEHLRRALEHDITKAVAQRLTASLDRTFRNLYKVRMKG